MLGNVCDGLGEGYKSRYEQILFRSFLFAFFAALRIGEFVARNKRSPATVTFSDVIFKVSFVSIFIRFSYTDQLARGAWPHIGPIAGSPFCPVAAMSEYLSVWPKYQGSFFIHLDCSNLTKYQFTRCLCLLNLGNLKFTSHSFRIGAATEAALLGLDSSINKRIGRWKSDQYKLYIRPNLAVSSVC